MKISSNSSLARFISPCVALSAALCVALAPIAAQAELPPYVYGEWQAAAPEAIVLTVIETKLNTVKTAEFERTSVFSKARVDTVTRSKSGLKKGQIISIRTITEKALLPGWAGPNPIPLLEQGKQYQAWLKPGGSVFYAAAKGRSFLAPETPVAVSKAATDTTDETDCDCAP